MTQTPQKNSELKAIDELAIQALMESMPGVKREIAEETYKMGMMLREAGIKESERRECLDHWLVKLIRSDIFFRLILIVAIPLLRAAYGPLIRLIVRLAR